MAQNTFEVRVGRLIEVRIVKGFESAADVEYMRGLAARTMRELPPDFRAVTAADWRACTLLSPAAAQVVARMFASANGNTDRSAVLYSRRSPTAVMQLMRLIKDSEHPQRRMFEEPEPMAEWLGESLNDAESARLREFLGILPLAQTR